MYASAAPCRAAAADLHELRNYLIQNFRAATWRSSYRKIKKSVATSEQHPLLGRIPPELEALGISPYRQVLSGMNRIIYELRGDTAYIHVICDTRRDLRQLLLLRMMRKP